MAARMEGNEGFDRRSSTGRNEHSKDEKSKNRLRKENFLQPNSDEIDLNALLQAVLDINDKLQEQESKNKTERTREVDSVDSNSVSTMDSTVSFNSEFSRVPRPRPKSAKACTSASRPPPLERKNMSFCNDRVDQIDRENRRLLNEITRRTRPKSATVRRLPVEPVRVQTASEVNRQRFQRKVDIENQVHI